MSYPPHWGRTGQLRGLTPVNQYLVEQLIQSTDQNIFHFESAKIISSIWSVKIQMYNTK